MSNPITKLQITLADIDYVQRIDESREWRPIMKGDINPDQAVFVGFYAGDSPPIAEEIDYEIGGEETFWVYKTNYCINDLMDGLVSPQEIFEELSEEQPNIEIAGLCKYERDISPK